MMKCVFRPHYRDYKLDQAKIDDSQGMCVSESDYDSCWNRICSPNRSTILRDVLRGLLVLIGLAIVITIIFLLCYFLINDMEKKEEEIVDTLVKDFSSGHPMAAESEFDIVNENRLAPSDLETYETVPLLREDPGPAGVTLHDGEDERSNIQHLGNQGAFENIAVDPELPQHTEGDLMDSFMPGKELFDTAPEIMGETGKECVPLRLPLCSGSMPWSVTAFPNFVNNNNLFELQESLKYFQSIIVGSRCSARATEYTCAILEPSCGPDMVPLPPCRAFCEDIVQTCSEYFIGGNEHNSAFQCDRFPDSKNPNVCVDISRALPTQPSEPQADLTQDKAIADESSVLAKQDITGIPLEAVLEGREETAPEIVEMPTTEKTKSEPKMEVTPAVTNATESPVFICDHSKFLCDDGSDCLGNEFVCDGVQHCLDNSDEFNCTMSEKKPECTGDDFLCTSTKFCISRSWVCDGADDCTDNSDELNCDNFNDGDNFLAQETNLAPELLSIIPNVQEDGGAVNHPNVFTEVKVESFENVPVAPSAIDEDEVLAGFSKFGDNPDKEFGVGIIEEMFQEKEQPPSIVEMENESEDSIDDTDTFAGDTVSSNDEETNIFYQNNPENSNNEGTKIFTAEENEDSNDEVTNIFKQEVSEVSIGEDTEDSTGEDKEGSSGEDTRVSVPNVRRRRPLNPNLRRRRPVNPMPQPPQEIQLEDSQPSESIAETTSTKVVEWDSESRYNERPSDVRRQRIDIHNRRNNFLTNRKRVEQGNEEVKETLVPSLESIVEDDVPKVHRTNQGGRRRNRRPILPTSYESLKTRTEAPLRKPPSRRPVPLVRRRPTKRTDHRTPLSEKVEDFLKEEPQEIVEDEEEAPLTSINVQAMPITIPEQMVPTNVQNKQQLSDVIKETRAPYNDRTVKEQPPPEDEIEEYQYDEEEFGRPVEYQLPSKTFQNSQILPAQQQFEQNQQSQQLNEDTAHFNSPSQVYPHQPQEYERIQPQYEPTPQQYNIPSERYENSHPEYSQLHPSVQPQGHRQQQYENPQRSQQQYEIPQGSQQQYEIPQGSQQQYEIPQERYPEYKQTHQSIQNQNTMQQQYHETPKPFVKSQVHFNLGTIGQRQEYSNTGQNYHHRNVQAAEYADNPSYSRQTYQHPVHSENIYEYANPEEFPYGKAYPAGLRERYPAAQ